jgi:hypothetical protein
MQPVNNTPCGWRFLHHSHGTPCKSTHNASHMQAAGAYSYHTNGTGLSRGPQHKRLYFRVFFLRGGAFFERRSYKATELRFVVSIASSLLEAACTACFGAHSNLASAKSLTIQRCQPVYFVSLCSLQWLDRYLCDFPVSTPVRDSQHSRTARSQMAVVNHTVTQVVRWWWSITRSHRWSDGGGQSHGHTGGQSRMVVVSHTGGQSHRWSDGGDSVTHPTDTAQQRKCSETAAHLIAWLLPATFSIPNNTIPAALRLRPCPPPCLRQSWVSHCLHAQQQLLHCVITIPRAVSCLQAARWQMRKGHQYCVCSTYKLITK